MNERLILPSQKNEVFTLVRNRGLASSEFEWAKIESEESANLVVSALFYKPNEYYFVFDFYRLSESHVAHYSPGKDSTVCKVRTDDWPGQRRHVHTWLENLRREVEAPDLWGAIAQEKKLAEAASSSQTLNSPFTPQEQQSLAERIREIERYVIETHRLTGEHAEFVKRRLDYLADSVKRLGRLDWANVAQSVLISIILQIVIPPDAARELLRFAWTLLGSFFGGTPPLTLGP